ncbi:hypothetical protein [Rhizobium sp. 007]|uniref:hypothetical protein n=1 Tax=Rhizobium sp. 007 TaxID=2785056 RepID=UPI00188EEA2F|nr:hypothetical protein [Rhizobium sp. 007]QPB23072.1 hypothetical protein ISN39_26390 [Rhizobium sp. 007]
MSIGSRQSAHRSPLVRIRPAETPANGIFDATSADNLSLRLLKRLGMDFALAIATGAKQ